MELPGVGHSITIPRLVFESELCFDLYDAFLDEIDEAIKSAGLLYSQIDTVFALGEAKDNRRIREILQRFFPNKVQFEQTDGGQRKLAIMEKCEMFEQLAATTWFSDSQWKCSTFVWQDKYVELSCPAKYTHSTNVPSSEICKLKSMNFKHQILRIFGACKKLKLRMNIYNFLASIVSEL